MKIKTLYAIITFTILLCGCTFFQAKENGINTPTKTVISTNTPTFTQLSTNTLQPSETPTITPTVTPYHDQYYLSGLSEEQALALEQKMVYFQNAALNNDKTLVAQMINYPTFMYIGEDVEKITNAQDFLNIYDQLFNDCFINALQKQSIIDAYMISRPYAIYVLIGAPKGQGYCNIQIDFTFVGQISRIYYSEWNTHKYTDTPTFTATPLNNILDSTSTPTPYLFVLSEENERDFSTYYGKWIITRFEFIGEPYVQHDEEANLQIGKKVEFLATEINADDNFLAGWSTHYKYVSYAWVFESFYHEEDDWDVPLPNNNSEKRADPLYLQIYCEGIGTLEIAEITATGRMVLFDHGYWYFLDKMTN